MYGNYDSHTAILVGSWLATRAWRTQYIRNRLINLAAKPATLTNTSRTSLLTETFKSSSSLVALWIWMENL